MAAALSKEGSLFRPPAPDPRKFPALVQGLATFRSQIEGLPQAVFEDEAWQPPIPGMPLFIMAPDAIRRVLLTDADQFPAGDLFARMMRPVWGKGLLLAEPDSWKVQRRAVSDAFRPGAVEALAPYFLAVAKQALARWKTLSDGRADIFSEMKRITFDVILDTMLSGATAFDRADFARSAEAFFADISRIRMSYILMPDAWHTERRSHDSPHRKPLIAHIQKLVTERRPAPPRGDLVDLLLKARDPETGEGLSDGLLCDNLLGFIMAGYETTSTALTWALYLVAAHPPTRQQLLEEAEDALGPGRDVEPASLKNLPFARAVISETMRLYPSAFLLTRVSLKDTQLAGRPVKAGQRINIPVYAIHRRADVWPNPDVFDPSRFLPDRPQPDRFAYLPFGAGPRICVGASFAMAEMVTVLVTLLRGADFTLSPKARIWPQTGLALYPRHGLPMQVTPR